MLLLYQQQSMSTDGIYLPSVALYSLNISFTAVPYKLQQCSAFALHCCKAHAKINRKIGNSTPCKIVTHENLNTKLGRQTVKALGNNLVRLRDPSFSRFITIHSRYRRQTSRRGHGLTVSLVTSTLRRKTFINRVLFSERY